MSDPRHALALRGERLAEAFLKKRGLKLIARRFSTPAGELDLVLQDGATIVFVEVKTRRSRRWTDPEEALTSTKWSRLTKAARWFARQRACEDSAFRFDAVTVLLAEAAPPEIAHTPDAFVPRDW